MVALVVVAGCSAARSRTQEITDLAAPAVDRSGAIPAYLYVWATAFDTMPTRPVAPDTVTRVRQRGVLLLVIDLREGSPSEGMVVRVILADSMGRHAHHTEHALAPDGILFANDFGSGNTYRFDLSSPGEPRLLGHFTTAGPFAFPHSFVQLPSGNVLATFQWQEHRQSAGGLVELRRDGTAVRWSHAAASGNDSARIHPYSLELLPTVDRVVTTSTSMVEDVGMHVQVWRLSDLSLLHTLQVPQAPAHHTHLTHAGSSPGLRHLDSHHLLPGEPRVLDDGRTVMLGTFTCGLYRLTGLEGTMPRLDFSHAFPGENCAVPVRAGRWWVQTVPAQRALAALDVSDPAQPREASRLVFQEPVSPHWLASDPSGRWLVMNSGSQSDRHVHLVSLENETGALAHHPTIPRIDLSRVAVPELGVVRAVPHGAVFGNAKLTDTASR